jgi:g-D-glutamyl-meso-diaminopimelate peptidase
LTIAGLLARYHFLRVQSIGNSVMGREIPCILMGEGETEVTFSAAHHGNESITCPLSLLFLETYAEAYAAKGEIDGISAVELYQNTTLHLIPLVNPDGVDLVNGILDADDSFFTQAKALSEFYPDIPFPSGWKANIRGVDLNLQYPADWEQAKEIKYAQGFTRPGPRDFVGLGPLTEPESLALYQYTLEHNFRLLLALHTQGKVIFWKYKDMEPAASESIVRAFEAASGYEGEDTPAASSNAGYRDWFIQTYRLPGFTLEAGCCENPLPIKDLFPIFDDCLGIFALALQMA